MPLFLSTLLEKITNFFAGSSIKKQEFAIDTLLDAMANTSTEETTHTQEPSLETIRKMKKDFFEKSLQGGIASLFLDPRVEGVVVPEKFRNLTNLVLNYSYRFHVADFNFDDVRVVASLSFGGIPYQCIVPWDAVMGVGNQGEGTFFTFSHHDEHFKDAKTVQQIVTKEEKVFDQTSHDRALERRKQFQVIKGGKYES